MQIQTVISLLAVGFISLWPALAKSAAASFPHLETLISKEQQKTDLEQHISRGLVGLGYQPLSQSISTFGLQRFPWLSVGSGNGLIEQALRSDGISLKTVEPCPREFICIDKPVTPDFDYVHSFVSSFASPKDIPRNLVLFLNWAEPSLDYDMDAVTSVSPLYILSIYETSGGAAGERFRSFVEDTLQGRTAYRAVARFERNVVIPHEGDEADQASDDNDLDLRLILLVRHAAPTAASHPGGDDA